MHEIIHKVRIKAVTDNYHRDNKDNRSSSTGGSPPADWSSGQELIVSGFPVSPWTQVLYAGHAGFSVLYLFMKEGSNQRQEVLHDSAAVISLTDLLGQGLSNLSV